MKYRFKIKIFLFFIICFFPFSLLHSAKIYPSAASTSAAFLKIPVGSRQSAMGGAFTSVSDDVYASFYNPAGLSYLSDRNLSFMHNNYFSGLDQFYLAYNLSGEDIKFLNKYPYLRKGNWAFSLNYFFTPKDLERRSGLYENDPLYPISPVEGKFRAWDLAFGLHYGFNYNPETNLGASLKFITQNIDRESGSSIALDLGIMKKFEMYDRVFSGGFSIQNIGPGIKFNSKRYDLPLAFKAGISYRQFETNTLFSFDIHKYIDNYPFLILGIEHYLSEKLFLRTGYKYRINGNELGGWSGFNAGIGFIYNNFAFDYSFTPYGDLGYSHKLTLTFKFKAKKAPEIISPHEAIKASEKIIDIKQFSYNVVSKQQKLTPYYAEFEINGENSEIFISSITFKTRARGLPDNSLYVLTGKLPSELSGKVNIKDIYSVFQISYSGMILSSINLKIKIEKKWFEILSIEKEKIKILYLTKKGFQENKLEFLNEDENYFYYSAKVPLSSHYVLGN